MWPSSDTGVGRTAHLRARQVQARLKMPGSGGSPDQALRSGASGRRSTSTSPGPGPRPASGGGSWEGLRRQHSRLSAGGARCAPIIFAVARRARTQHLMRASLARALSLSLSLCVLRSLALSLSLSPSLSLFLSRTLAPGETASTPTAGTPRRARRPTLDARDRTCTQAPAPWPQSLLDPLLDGSRRCDGATAPRALQAWPRQHVHHSQARGCGGWTARSARQAGQGMCRAVPRAGRRVLVVDGQSLGAAVPAWCLRCCCRPAR
jgi:hypothetical protein